MLADRFISVWKQIDTPRASLRNFFHWNKAGVIIPVFFGGGLALMALAFSVPGEGAPNVFFGMAYLFFVLAGLWSVGYWWTCDCLNSKRPLKRLAKTKPEEYKQRMRSFVLWRTIVTVLLASLTVSFMYATYIVKLSKELAATYGILIPANESSPPTIKLPDGLTVFLGDNCLVTNTFPMIIAAVHNEPVLTLDRDASGKVYISTTIVDPEGKVEVRLERNAFTINTNNTLRFSRPDKSGLIVEDQYGDEVLNIRYLNREAIRLAAHLRYPGGVKFDFTGEPFVKNLCFVIPKGSSADTLFYAH